MTEGSVHSIKRRWLVLGALASILMGGLLFAGGKVAFEHTNTVEFCTSCHEMAENNYEEYKKTVHAHSKTGVKAICSDCHVPHEFPDVLIRKVMAVNDIYHHLMGTVDTPEKFNARRLDLAKKVWIRMKTTDSRECRNCHDVNAMARDQQGKVAQTEHKKLFAGTRTCIDCHYGIAHKEPPGGLEPDDVMPKSTERKAELDGAAKSASAQ